MEQKTKETSSEVSCAADRDHAAEEADQRQVSEHLQDPPACKLARPGERIPRSVRSCGSHAELTAM